MDKISYLDYLYYKIGKQTSDIELQIQKQEGFMSKRRKYSDAGFSKDTRWLAKANARTILINEGVLDFDPDKDETQEKFENRVVSLTGELKDNATYYGIFNSNRGIHVHLFFKEMFEMSEKKRNEFRKFLIKRYNADLMKASERVTIALEFANHWKSGKVKEMIDGNLFSKGKLIDWYNEHAEEIRTPEQVKLLKKFAKEDPFKHGI